VSDANRLIAAFKRPQKVASIVRCSNHVIAGNEYLAGYARQFNHAVTVIPTSVDTQQFAPATRQSRGAPDEIPVLGWIGSPTTGTYIRSLTNVLRRVREQHPFVLRVSGVGERLEVPGVAVQHEPWRLDREVELFNTCDLGVYPLADDEWSKGKCGFKAIEFMACGVPVVASAVGVNRDIIHDGENGFLASNEDQWVEKIGRLLSDAALRRRFAAAGRETVEAGYSLRVNAPKLAATLRAVAERGRFPLAAPAISEGRR
jgi:glycosyltransferase involved in cell wall biosynthesis